uniref:Uncharacterized protein n=1 Tax=Cucumis sativus TaxID=3659 RepID=A0A0A0KJH4_CUCSA
MELLLGREREQDSLTNNYPTHYPSGMLGPRKGYRRRARIYLFSLTLGIQKSAPAHQCPPDISIRNE